MKLNKILKIITIIFPMIAMYSCSFQKDTLEKVISDQNSSSIDIPVNVDTPKQIDELKKDNTIYFNFNKSIINAKFSKILNKIAKFLYNNPNINIIIEGHTDKRGSEKYNIELGKRRAESVKLYLESKGIPSKQISIISYGSDKPAEIGDKEDIYSKNRRAIVVY
ncbi:MAG: OmpA family protein [Buchnera aphidicola (Floraphis choui)]